MIRRSSIYRFVAAVLFACFLAQTPCQAQADLSQNPVYLAFAEYKSAILENDAERALQAVDATTVQYYADMLNHALNSEEAVVRQLRTMDLLMVLSIRHRLTTEQAKGFDASSLFKHGVANGWIGKESVMGIEVVAVDIEGSTAKTTFTSNGIESPFGFRFDNEGGTWKIDLTSIMDASGLALGQLAEQQGLTEVELMFMLLEMITSKEIDNEAIWMPINHR